MIKTFELNQEVKANLIANGKNVLFHVTNVGIVARKIKDPRGKWGQKSVRYQAKRLLEKHNHSVVVEYIG